MEFYWIYFVYAMLCSYVKHSSEQSGLPVSPCANLLQYVHDGTEWIGMLQVQGFGQTIKLEVTMSLQRQLPSQFFGVLQLYGTRDAAIQEILSNQPIRYTVRFPTQNPLPKLTQISVNGQILCTGEPETAANVIQIRLEHTLFVDNNITYPQPPYINNQDNYYSQIYQQPVAMPEVKPLITPNQTSTDNNTTQMGSITLPLGYHSNNVPTLHSALPQTPYTNQTTGYVSDVQCGIPHPRYSHTVASAFGNTVSRGTWPWLVAVYLYKATGPSFNCNGNLISPKTVVTAAHCFRTPERQYAAYEVLLFLGRYNILDWNENGAKPAQVDQIIIHNDYMTRDSSFDADIALAIMRDSVQYTEFIRPICLWEGPSNVPEIGEGTVIGWGEDGTGKITDLPAKINIPMVPEVVCLRSSDTYLYITSPRTFCAGSKNGLGPCKGDSGSGMIFKRNNKWMLRGIFTTSLSIDHCNLYQYVVFTDAAKFITWIRSYMR